MAFEEENGDSEKKSEKGRGGAQRRKRGRRGEWCGPRQRDIVQIAESGDIDHRGAAAAEPSGTDTSDLSVPLKPLLLLPPLSLSLSPPSLILLFCTKRQDSFSPDCYTLKICFIRSAEFLEFYYSERLKISINSISLITCTSVWAASMRVY